MSFMMRVFDVIVVFSDSLLRLSPVSIINEDGLSLICYTGSFPDDAGFVIEKFRIRPAAGRHPGE